MGLGRATALAALVGVAGLAGYLGGPCRPGAQARAAVGTGSAPRAEMAFRCRWARDVTIR